MLAANVLDLLELDLDVLLGVFLGLFVAAGVLEEVLGWDGTRLGGEVEGVCKVACFDAPPSRIS